MFNIHRINIALFFILLCTTADDLTDCSTDIYKHAADAHLIKAGTTWIANALRREKFELKAYFCEKVWCVDGASIYFCNNHPDDDTVKGQYREIAKRMETLLEKCEDKDKGTVGGEIRNRSSHLRVQYDDEECYVKKPDNF